MSWNFIICLNLKDEEIVEQKLTAYTTTDSLKTKRCNCMRKLKEVLKQT